MEFLIAVPSRYIVRQGESKFILREAMIGIVPEPIRKRMDEVGYATPQDAWFRGPSRRWAEDLLNSFTIEHCHLWHKKGMLELWQEYMNGADQHRNVIRRIINVHLALETFGG